MDVTSLIITKSDVTDNSTCPKKSHTEISVRIKPIGAGAGDKIHNKIEPKWTRKKIQHVDTEKMEIMMGEDGEDRKRFREYKFPHFVAEGEKFNQQDIYDGVLKERITDFLDGFNVNIMAYGQTGSGKTHTMLGPKGFSKSPQGDEILDYYGLFPRAGMILLKSLEAQAQTGRKTIMTLNITETNYKVPLDLINKFTLKMCPTKNELIGQKEVIIDSVETLFAMCHILENERTTAGTKMNDNSSRTHCIAELKLYTKVGEDKVHINFFKFVDMAGSERTEKSEAMNEFEAQAWMINFTLSIFARAVLAVGELKKPLTGGEKLPPSCSVWKETGITKTLKDSFNGMAFTSIMICLSGHPANGGESFATLQFADNCKKMRANIVKPKQLSMPALIKECEGIIKANLADLKKNDANKRFKELYNDKQQFLIDLYNRLLDWK